MAIFNSCVKLSEGTPQSSKSLDYFSIETHGDFGYPHLENPHLEQWPNRTAESKTIRWIHKTKISNLIDHTSENIDYNTKS